MNTHSSNSATDLWGQDIALDAQGQAKVAANGELVLTDGVETGVQDIGLRLFQRLGVLFYDTSFGSLIFDWIYEENTPENRNAFVDEVITRVEMDPRVVPYSVNAAILKWDEKTFIASVDWRFIEEDQPHNLIMQFDKQTKELIVHDTKADPRSFSADLS